MSKRPTLVALEAEPPAVGAIGLLEDLLEQVKQGMISSLAVAVVFRDGSGDQHWTFAPSTMALIGSADVLVHRLIAEALDGD